MLKRIFYFFLTNLFAALIIYLNLLDGKADMLKFLQTRDIMWGVDIYLAVAVGIVVAPLRFRLIRSESNRELNKFEKNFLIGLCSASFFGFYSMAYLASIMIFGKPLPGFVDTLVTIVGIIAFWMFLVEIYSFTERDSTAKFTKIQKQIINFLTNFYVASGIAAVWNILVFDLFKDINTPLGLLALVSLCILILIPFQRHFWFEVMLLSRTKKENMLIIATIIITVILAIIPVYLVNMR